MKIRFDADVFFFVFLFFLGAILAYYLLPPPLLPLFRLDCQSDLSASITKLNSKSKLFVVREAPQTVLVKLFKAWSISHLVFEKDTDAYAKDRDSQVVDMAKEAGVEVITKVGRTLFDPDELVRVNGGKPTMSISQVQNVRDVAA